MTVHDSDDFLTLHLLALRGAGGGEAYKTVVSALAFDPHPSIRAVANVVLHNFINTVAGWATHLFVVRCHLLALREHARSGNENSVEGGVHCLHRLV